MHGTILNLTLFFNDETTPEIYISPEKVGIVSDYH